MRPAVSHARQRARIHNFPYVLECRFLSNHMVAETFLKYVLNSTARLANVFYTKVGGINSNDKTMLARIVQILRNQNVMLIYRHVDSVYSTESLAKST